MTSKVSTATLTLATDLSSDDYGRDGSVLYRVAPGKGARVSGVVELSTSTHDVEGYGEYHRRVVVETCASMTLAVPHVRTKYGKADPEPLEPLTVNGRALSTHYSLTLEFYPQRLDAASYANVYDSETYRRNDDKLADGDPFNYRSTLLGEPGHWKARSYSFDSLSDAARRTVTELANLAVEQYMTDALAAAALVRCAEYPLDSARRELETARKALDDAERHLEAVTERVSGFLA